MGSIHVVYCCDFLWLPNAPSVSCPCSDPRIAPSSILPPSASVCLCLPPSTARLTLLPNPHPNPHRKDPTEYTGVEQYVKSQMDDNEMLWVPVRSAFAIQNNGAYQKMKQEAEEERLAALEAESGPKKKKRKKVRRGR